MGNKYNDLIIECKRWDKTILVKVVYLSVYLRNQLLNEILFKHENGFKIKIDSYPYISDTYIGRFFCVGIKEEHEYEVITYKFSSVNEAKKYIEDLKEGIEYINNYYKLENNISHKQDFEEFVIK